MSVTTTELFLNDSSCFVCVLGEFWGSFEVVGVGGFDKEREGERNLVGVFSEVGGEISLVLDFGPREVLAGV